MASEGETWGWTVPTALLMFCFPELGRVACYFSELRCCSTCPQLVPWITSEDFPWVLHHLPSLSGLRLFLELLILLSNPLKSVPGVGLWNNSKHELEGMSACGKHATLEMAAASLPYRST